MKPGATLQKAAHNLLPATAYGDAAGLPVETWSAARIKAEFDEVKELLPTRYNPFYVREFEAGTWSDDTQLSLAVARAIIKANGFDMRVIADEHVVEYNQTPQITKPSGQCVKRGWGGSTTYAVERYIDGTPIDQCGQPDGSGNGVIMKMAPLALWLIAQEIPREEVYPLLDQFTSFAHDSVVARVATRTHFDVLNHLARAPYPLTKFGDVAYRSAVDHEDN